MNPIADLAPQVAHTMDLYGRAENSRLMLWRRAAQVMPLNAFERAGRWIKSGHYVIDYKGDAIVVHCANRADGRVSVQFMHDEWLIYAVDRSTIEPMLLGKLVVSEEQQAAVCEGRRLSNYFANDGPAAAFGSAGVVTRNFVTTLGSRIANGRGTSA